MSNNDELEGVALEALKKRLAEVQREIIRLKAQWGDRSATLTLSAYQLMEGLEHGLINRNDARLQAGLHELLAALNDFFKEKQ